MPNYSNLVSDIKAYMEDDGAEFTASIDTFIDVAGFFSETFLVI